jgi:hypothetical protein
LAIPYDPVDIELKAGLVGVLASLSFFLAGIFVQNWNEKKKANERLSRVCKTVLIEVNNLYNWYKGKEYELKKSHYIQNAINPAPYENIINTAPYNGILNSGLITYLEEDTQNKLNTFYFYASLHNKRIYDLAQIFNDKASSPEIKNLKDEQVIKSSTAWQLNVAQLINYEMEMQKLIPELKTLLEDEIKEVS